MEELRQEIIYIRKNYSGSAGFRALFDFWNATSQQVKSGLELYADEEYLTIIAKASLKIEDKELDEIDVKNLPHAALTLAESILRRVQDKLKTSTHAGF